MFRVWVIAALSLAGLVCPLSAAAEETVGIRGTVVDRSSGEPVAGARVSVVGRDVDTLTDAQGRFFLRVPPGKYALRAWADWHRPVRVKGLRVEDGRVVSIRIPLPPDGDSTQTVWVEARADARKETVLLEKRKRSASMTDAVGAQEMSRAPDSSAGDALKRVVSTTIVDGKYIIIRGLGGRYTTTLLNGVPLPSPDPDEPAVPLDLFPAALLSNLTVAKSFSPELPGAFAGGAVLIETSTYPERFEARVKLSGSGDSATTFRLTPTYEGGTADFLGFDDGTRTLPGSVPEGGPLSLSNDAVDLDLLERVGEAMPNVWTLNEARAWPNLSLGATIGDTVEVGGGKLGYLTSLTWSHAEKRRAAEVGKVKVDGGDVAFREERDVLTGTEAASLGLLGSLGWQPGPAHDLGLFVLWTHQGDKVAQLASGYSESDSTDATSSRLQFTTRQLVFGQLRGTHRVAAARGMDVRWQTNVSFTERDEPDTRDLGFTIQEDGTQRFDAGPGSGERLFATLTDVSYGASLGFGVPFDGVKLDLGASVQGSAREYDARRFRFDFVGREPETLFLPAEEMLSAEHIGPDFRLTERTMASDAYDAAVVVGAGWLGLDITAGDPVRVIPGVRFEAAMQTLDPGTPFAVTDDSPDGVDRLDLSWLPAISTVWTIRPDMNLRAAYGWTLARAQLRELAPLLYFDFVRRRSVSGNPDLELTRIHNADLRWEWFPREGAVLAASVFYKHFDSPIERVILSAAAGDVGFENAPSAYIIGGELEAKATLGFISAELEALRLQANVTVLHSEVEFDADQATVQTSRSRALQGQSPWVVNAGIGWTQASWGFEVGLFYNVAGPRIVEVGFDGLPDVMEEPIHRLDLSLSQSLPAGLKLKLAAQNLAYQPVRLTQGGLRVFEAQPGVTVSASLEWAWSPTAKDAPEKPKEP